MNKLNESLEKKVHIGYLTYHRKEEHHHSQSMLVELLESFLKDDFDQEKFFLGAQTVLTQGIQAFFEAQLKEISEKDKAGGWPEKACATG